MNNQVYFNYTTYLFKKKKIDNIVSTTIKILCSRCLLINYVTILIANFFIFVIEDLNDMYILLEHQAPIEEYAKWLSIMILHCVVKVS